MSIIVERSTLLSPVSDTPATRRAAREYLVQRGWQSIAAIRNALDDLEYGFESAPDTPGHILDLFYQLIDEIDSWRETRHA